MSRFLRGQGGRSLYSESIKSILRKGDKRVIVTCYSAARADLKNLKLWQIFDQTQKVPVLQAARGSANAKEGQIFAMGSERIDEARHRARYCL